MSRIRVTRTAVEQMAAANHVPATFSPAAVSVVLGGVMYFWTAR